MTMGNNNRTDAFLDTGIKNALTQKTEDRFTDKIMSEIILQNKYILEDKKTGRRVRFFSTAVSISLAAFVIILGMQFFSGTESTPYNAGNIILKANEIIEDFNIKTENILGISYSFKFFIQLIIISAGISLFSLLDKIFIRKSCK